MRLPLFRSILPQGEKRDCQINEINLKNGEDHESKFDLKHLSGQEIDVFSKNKMILGISRILN